MLEKNAFNIRAAQVFGACKLFVALAQLIITSRISKTTSVRFSLDTYSALEIVYFTLSSHKNSLKIPAACSSVAAE